MALSCWLDARAGRAYGQRYRRARQGEFIAQSSQHVRPFAWPPDPVAEVMSGAPAAPAA